MKPIFSEQAILMNAKIQSRDDAIRAAGQLLVDGGYVTHKYIDYMLKRESIVSTYMGNNLAIPHGADGAEAEIIHSGISLVQVPEGILFGEDELAYVVIGIAGKDGTHLDILGEIAVACTEVETINSIRAATSKSMIISQLGISQQ